MEYNFDKEIDILLRQAARGGGIESANAAGAHLDADEISMFAENAMPERARARAVKHFAECDDCRMILSNVILLNSEDKTASVVEKETIAPIVADLPWYKRLFAFPQIAVGMGALALFFSGVVGFLIYQTATENRSLDMAQTKAPTSANRAAMNANTSEIAPDFNAGVSNAMSANDPAANAAANVSPAANTSVAQSSDSDASASVKPPAPVQQPAATAPSKPEAEMSADGASGAETRLKADQPENRAEDRDEKTAAAEALKAPPPPAPAAKKDQARSGEEPSSTLSRAPSQRQVGGKTFNRVNGVWIDTEYRKMMNTQLSGLTTVRRGSGAYKKLDRNIRVIAESLEGEVIVVSGNTAYRIY